MFALLCANGVQPHDVWEMTYGECADIARAIEERMTAEQERTAALAWKTAEMVGQYIAWMFGKGAPRPQGLYQAFPWMSKPVLDWQTLKERFAARAQAHNARRKQDNN